MDAPYFKLEPIEPGIARLLAHNPSPFTFTGTQTYFVGTEEVAVIDPGPDLPDHLDALVNAIGGRSVKAIACTHTHRDHSPAARPLSERIGAPVIGCAPLAVAVEGFRADEAFDPDYRPDQILGDGEAIAVDGMRLVAVATPGHTSNHLCYALEPTGALFSGDHVMAWSTSVVIPPDGDMADYMASLDKLRRRGERILFPAHGPPVTNPDQYLRHLMGHRMSREKQILRLVEAEPRAVPDIVLAAYPDLNPRLRPAAGASVLAHLLDLERRGVVTQMEETWSAA